MRELHWLPDQIGKLTVSQMLCILSRKPPGREADPIPKSEADGLENS